LRKDWGPNSIVELLPSKHEALGLISSNVKTEKRRGGEGKERKGEGERERGRGRERKIQLPMIKGPQTGTNWTCRHL
jgi:hypothetical protein